MSLALVLVVASALVFFASGLNQSEPAVVQAVDAAGSGSAARAEQRLSVDGIILMGAGAVLARRSRACGGRRVHLMQRDTRPPVLYLRSFGDDALKLWTATFGRPAARALHPAQVRCLRGGDRPALLATGPVIALNPPDTKLAPLGAARETLDSADWQTTISESMSRSAVIVFVMPPGQVTRGLTWELQHLSANQYWTKT